MFKERLKTWLTVVLVKRLLVAAMASAVAFLADQELLDGVLAGKLLDLLSAS